MSDTMRGAGAHNEAREGNRDDNGILWPYGRGLVALAKSALWLAPSLAALMLLVHFWRVGHLPMMSFSELGVVLGAFGLFVAMGLAVALLLILLPVYLLFSWTGASLLPAPPKGQRRAHVLKRRSLSRRPLRLADAATSAAKRRTFSSRIIPGSFGMFLLASATALFLSMTALLWLPQGWRSTVLLALWIGGFVVPLAIEVWKEIGISPRVLRRMRRWWPQCLLLLSLYAFLWPSWMVLLVWFDAWPAPDSAVGWILPTLFALAFVPWLHWMWYATMRGQGVFVIEVRVVTGGAVLLYAGLMTPLIDGAASAYGFGMLQKVDLLLSARGCAIVREALPGQACAPSPASGDDTSRVYRLLGVDVLTRIGADYVVAPAGGIRDRRLPRVVLPAGEVHGLVRRIENAPVESAPAKSAPVESRSKQ